MARKNKKEEIKRPLSGKIVLAILVISIVWGIAIMSLILPVIGLVIFIGWWVVVTADSVDISYETREKKIMRENLETWNKHNKSFINKLDKEEARHIHRLSADESSTVGHFGGDCGNGGFL